MLLSCVFIVAILAGPLSNNDALVPGATLQALVANAQAQGAASVLVPSAQYNFSTSTFAIANAANLTINGAGSTLWFAPGGGVALHNCTNVSLTNFDLDFTPTLAQGTVVSVDIAAHSFQADFDPIFLPANELVPPDSMSKMKVLFIDPRTKRMVRNPRDPAAINIFTTPPLVVPTPSAAHPHRYRVNVTGNLGNGWTLAAPNQPVLLFPRGGSHSLLVEASARCTFTDVHIFGGTAMGVVESGGAGGHTYTRFALNRRPLQRGTDMQTLPAPQPFRFLASNADGFHSTSNGIGPSLIDSTISWTGDDLANICCAMSVALTEVAAVSSSGSGSGNAALAMVDVGHNLARAAKRGDRISFYHLNSLELQGSAVVESVATTKDAAALAAMRSGYATMQAAPYNAHFVQGPVASAFAQGDPIAITFQGGVVPAFVQKYWSIAVLYATDNSNAVVKNTTLSDGYARAFMIKGRDALFTNSTFRRAGGIWIGPEQPWLEGDPGLRNVTIEDNVFDAIGLPPVNTRSDFNETGREIVVRNNVVREL
jgi:hypothetical protein